MTSRLGTTLLLSPRYMSPATSTASGAPSTTRALPSPPTSRCCRRDPASAWRTFGSWYRPVYHGARGSTSSFASGDSDSHIRSARTRGRFRLYATTRASGRWSSYCACTRASRLGSHGVRGARLASRSRSGWTVRTAECQEGSTLTTTFYSSVAAVVGASVHVTIHRSETPF
jgi:hypothetical protein